MAIKGFFRRIKPERNLKKLEMARERYVGLISEIKGFRVTAERSKSLRDKSILEALLKVRTITLKIRKGAISKAEARKMISFIDTALRNAELQNAELERWSKIVKKYTEKIDHPEIRSEVEMENSKIDLFSCELFPNGSKGLSYAQAVEYIVNIRERLMHLLHN
ncbi:MAG: hypothetical protein N3F05_01040 [Candidatus Diapherotrites archaeon]|nr:hypothetical protein [Candidatus Diapherotrites archaeon]